MGKVVQKTKKKKKGRPSLLDLQKRSLKQQQQHQFKKNPKFQNPSPNSSLRRSTRRNSNPNSNSDDEDSSGGNRREKKLKLFVKAPDDPNGGENSGSDSDQNDDDSSSLSLRKRKIDSISDGSGLDTDAKGQKLSAATNQTTTQQGSNVDDGPSTPLPDIKLLLFILDRLQKKDTYGVFAEPVDPEELPDYHELIQYPMDFGTVRKKLADGAYVNLEQFERDIFLICSNGMQYNAPDTIYFRQARTIKDLAKKDFENLRQDSDDNEPEPEPEPESEPKVVRRGRPPTKNLKRPPGRPPLERANSNFSEASIATVGGNPNRSNNNMRKGPSTMEKCGCTNSSARPLCGSRYGEAYIGWSAERYERTDDITGSALKGISVKHRKKHIVLDENIRNTYMQTYTSTSRQEPSVLTTFDGERKQLIAVGLHAEYAYARSLARFASKLGPVAWKVASRRIERCLPAVVQFGPGWVGENEATQDRLMSQQFAGAAGQPSTPQSLSVHGDSTAAFTRGTVVSSGDMSELKPHEEQLSESHLPSSRSKLDESITATPPSSIGPSSSAGGGPHLNAPEVSSRFSNSNSTTPALPPLHIHQGPTIQYRTNGLNGGYGISFMAQMSKMIGAATPSGFSFQPNPSQATVSRRETDTFRPPSSGTNISEAKWLENSSIIRPTGYLPNEGLGQKDVSVPPDLNVGFESPGSPVSRRANPMHPDLALQL